MNACGKRLFKTGKGVMGGRGSRGWRGRRVGKGKWDSRGTKGDTVCTGSTLYSAYSSISPKLILFPPPSIPYIRRQRIGAYLVLHRISRRA